MSRILLLLDHRENRRLLADWLTRHHSVLLPEATPDTAFDLCIADGPALAKHREVLRHKKEAEHPIFLPVLLILPRTTRGPVPDSIWTYVDERLTAPIEKAELQTRVDLLLRTRELSLDLKSHLDELQRRFDDQTRLQRELVAKNIELEKLNQQKNQFLGMAAHDLRTPLGVISTYSQLLQEDLADSLDTEHLEFITDIRSSSAFMRNLIDDLLDITAIEAGRLVLNLRPTDLTALVRRNAASNHLLAAKKQTRVEFIADEPVPVIPLDPARMEQVLNNLIGNAVKFSPPGATVEIRLIVQAETLIIAVSDQGPGIPPDQQKRLFEPFQPACVRPTAGEKSTGLGLVITRRIVEAHGGEIWLESAVGRGTTFYVSLPTHPRQDMPDPQVPRSPIREEIFDPAAALQRFDGDPAALSRSAAAFLEEYPALLREIQNTLSRRSGKPLEHAAYDLGWRLGTLGAPAAFDAALTLERLGREENLAGAEKAYVLLECELTKLAAALNTLQPSENPASIPAADSSFPKNP